MTPTPDLTTTLRELARVLGAQGGRLRLQIRTPPGGPQVETLWGVYGGREHRIGILSPDRLADLDRFTLIHVECILREECVARGWDWTITGLSTNPLNCRFQADLVPAEDPDTDLACVQAEIPAHAFALAVLAALTPEVHP
jgi:hypothetical protein